MTIRQLMKRIAGDDYDWDIDPGLMGMGAEEIQMGMLTGVGKDGRPFMFRLPLEKLVAK
jgi:hypothetical protein